MAAVFDAATIDKAILVGNSIDGMRRIRRGGPASVTPVTVAASKLLADNIPGAKLNVIKEVGHFYQLEKPADFNVAVKQFIASLNLKLGD